MEPSPTARPYLSVVAPCYNEEEGLNEFCRRVGPVCEAVGLPYEIVLVNDGSTDQTWERMHELMQTCPGLVCVNLSRNHGHQLALTAGLSECRGQRILILDADLQDPPELLPQMLRMMDQGVDVVYGQRRRRAGETAMKRATASLFYRIVQRLADTPIHRDTGDFRLMSRRVLDVFLRMPERHRFVRGMISWLGFRQEPILYDRDPRFAGESKYPIAKMVRFAIDAITSFSVRPLIWARQIGVVMAVVAMALLLYAIVGFFTGKTAAGWASLMATVTLLGAVQLFMLGVFGEYLGRLCDQAKGRPLFIIESVARSPEPSAGSVIEEKPQRRAAAAPLV